MNQDAMSQNSMNQNSLNQDSLNQGIAVSKCKVVISFIILIVWMLIIVALILLAKIFRPSRVNDLVKLFHRGVLRCLNIECIVEGCPLEGRPTLYVSNHISYIDIFILGSVLPGTYIAKSEVAKWPLFGQLAKLQNTLFIERRSQKVGNQIQQIQRHLLDKSNLILFPEGTSDIGTYVAPFHSSFFQAAQNENFDITIAPVTVSYTHYKNERMDRSTREYYAWYKPKKILPHFLNSLGIGRGRVRLICHEPVKLDSFESRKACSRHCETVIRQGLLKALDLEKEVK